jgi:hypothetical protein
MAALLNEHSQNETPLIARNWAKFWRSIESLTLRAVSSNFWSL